MAMLDGVALVTGAASGIGRQLSVAYARAGCRALGLADVNIEGIHETVSLIKAEGLDVQTLSLRVDVTDRDSVKKMVSETVKAFGRIDYAANVAGVTATARLPTAQYPHDEYDKLLNINAKGILLCMQEEIQAMQQQTATCTPAVNNPLRAQRGSIINLASVTGFAALQNMMPYNVSKHAVVGLTKSAAIDHICDQIRINAVCPGMTETPMVGARGKASNWAVEGNGLQRLALPDEVADVCVFLSGCGASYMSGSSIVVDAGHLAALRYESHLSKAVEVPSTL